MHKLQFNALKICFLFTRAHKYFFRKSGCQYRAIKDAKLHIYIAKYLYMHIYGHMGIGVRMYMGWYVYGYIYMGWYLHGYMGSYLQASYLK